MQRASENRFAVKAVLSGSFRKDPEGLSQAFADLKAAGCEILSPLSTEVVSQADGFVFMQGDSTDPAEIERRHLWAITDANFVWLHAPNGYVGVSTAMEIGWAVAKGIPVLSLNTPSDPVIQDMVTVVPKLKLGAYTSLVIRNELGHFLTMHFTKKKERPWRFAGGKIEPGEQAIICAARELKEELGVEAKNLKLVYTHTHAVDNGIWTGFYYLADVIGTPQIMELDKNDEVIYFPAQRLEELGAYPESEVAFQLEEQDKKKA